jgi:hypothetical protein
MRMMNKEWEPAGPDDGVARPMMPPRRSENKGVYLLNVGREVGLPLAVHAWSHFPPPVATLREPPSIAVRGKSTRVPVWRAWDAAVPSLAAIWLVAVTALKLLNVRYNVLAIDKSPNRNEMLLDAGNEPLAVGPLAHVESLLNDIVAVGVAHHHQDRGLSPNLPGKLLEKNRARLRGGKLQKFFNHI